MQLYQSLCNVSVVVVTIIAIVFRILSNPLANVFQKVLTTKGQHPLAVNFLTYLALSLLCLSVAGRVPWSQLPVAFWLFSVLGGVAGAVGNGFLIKALQKGDLSVLGPINAYKSVVGLLIGFLLLGEVPGWWGITGVVLIIGGSYFVLDTTNDKFSWTLLKRKEIQYRLLALVLTAIEAVFIKKIILASTVTIAFISWCWFGALFSFLLLPVYHISWQAIIKKIKASHFSYYLFLVMCIGTMQFTTNYVLNHMAVGYALALFQLSTIVSVVLGHRLFKEQNLAKKLLGSVIMIGGSVLIILLKKG